MTAATVPALNGWWRARGMPASRDGFGRDRLSFGVPSPETLIERSQGFSLSDQYWLAGMGEGLGYDDGKFFENGFDGALGDLTLDGCAPYGGRMGRSPNAALGGRMRKAWVIDDDGTRALLKKSDEPTGQEPVNEYLASELYRMLLGDGAYVPYALRRGCGGALQCACPDMVGPTTEFVPVWSVVAPRTAETERGLYGVLLGAYKELGVAGARGSLDRMLTCDVLLGNYDRHLDNFGLIRDAETLEYVGTAPIYDTGDCLWRNKATGAGYGWRPLLGVTGRGVRQTPADVMALVGDLSWLDPDALKAWRAMALGRLSDFYTRERVDYISMGLDLTFKIVLDRKRETDTPVVPGAGAGE